MLEALPPEEAAFYSREANVLAPDRFLTLFWELDERFGFVGGAYDEYVKYFHRLLPAQLWDWACPADVEAVAGELGAALEIVAVATGLDATPELAPAAGLGAVASACGAVPHFGAGAPGLNAAPELEAAALEPVELPIAGVIALSKAALTPSKCIRRKLSSMERRRL